MSISKGAYLSSKLSRVTSLSESNSVCLLSTGASNSLLRISKVSTPSVLLVIFVNLCKPPYILSKSL